MTAYDDSTKRLWLGVAPYLQLGMGDRSRIEFGRWTIMRLSEYDGDWPDSKAEAAARALLAGYRDSLGREIRNPTVVVDADQGILFDLPDDDERESIQASVTLAVLDANPRMNDSDEDRQIWLATSDNAEVQFWPIAPPWDVVSFQTGSVARSLHGWTLLADDFAIPAPIETPSMTSGSPRQQVLRACFEYLIDRSVDVEERTRLRRSIEWLSKAWRNTPSITGGDRVVMLKVAFESILGTDASRSQAAALEKIFHDLSESDAYPRELEGLLWAPDERRDRVRMKPNGDTEPVSDIVHWYMALADARNQIVHGSDARSLKYEQCGSEYSGHLFVVGERLLRETLKAKLALAGHPQVWQSYIDPKILADLQRAIKAELGDELEASRLSAQDPGGRGERQDRVRAESDES